jgi:hypothetical protein
LLSVFLLAWQLPARAADTGPTPQQIQGLIASGQESRALTDLQRILQTHPDSGVAWYLSAEADDAAGNPEAARAALARADQFAPGLPFANPQEVAALRAHLDNPTSTGMSGAMPARHGSGIGGTVLVIGAFVVLFFVIRMFLRSRGRNSGYPDAYRGGFPGNPPGPYPGGPMGGMGYGGGSGIGGSIIGGLAAGAGFAAGERIIDGMMGGGNAFGERGIAPQPGIDPNAIPARDDGLTGSPGWDNGGSGQDDNSDFDPGNNW